MALVDPENESASRTIEIPSTLMAARKPEDEILRYVEKFNYGEEASFAIKLALEEALTNAVKHGNQDDPTKTITIRYDVSPRKMEVWVRDQGEGFNPGTVPDPTKPDRLSLPCGRGIMLMRAYMDECRYDESGNEVYLMKKNPQLKEDKGESS